MKTQIMFGSVARWKKRTSKLTGGYAVIDVPKLGRQLVASDANGPFLIRAGESVPEFARLDNRYPPRGARIVVEVEVNGGHMHVSHWGCAIAYGNAEAKIAENKGRTDVPFYRLMYWENGVDRELARGPIFMINREFPRGDKDPLARYSSKGESNGYLYWLRREPRTLGEKEIVWVEVADPRPAPVNERIAKFAARFSKTLDVVAGKSPIRPKEHKLGHGFSLELKDLSSLTRSDLVTA